MRFFKYFIFLFSSFFSFNALAYEYSVQSFNLWRATPQLACNDDNGGQFISGTISDWADYVGYCYNNRRSVVRRGEAITCPVSGYPILTWVDYGAPIPSQLCYAQPDGSFCVAKWTGSGKPMVTNYPNRQLVILNSVSAIPSPSCTQKFDKSCDPKDPYGGCYTPPDDNCTRLADGSITCQEDTPPPEPDNACTGANYCQRPKEGCPIGYVAGSFNNQQLCVKSAPSSPTNPDDGAGASEPTGNNSNTSTSTSTSTSTAVDGTGSGITVNNTINVENDTTVNIDTDGIIGAIANVKDSLNVALSDLNNSVNSVSNILTGTNEKLDTANNTLDSIDQNTSLTNTKLDELINKDSEPFDDTGIIDAIGGISDKLTDLFGTDRDLSELEQLGTASNDSRATSAQNSAASSLNSLSNKLTFSSSECIPDLTINDVPVFGSVTIPLSHYCDLLALVKIFLHLATLFAALRIVESSVRAI